VRVTLVSDFSRVSSQKRHSQRGGGVVRAVCGLALVLTGGCTAGSPSADPSVPTTAARTPTGSGAAQTTPTSTETADTRTTATEPTTEPPADPPKAAKPNQVSLLVSGDVLLHSGTWATAEADAARRGQPGLDFRPMLADVAPVVRAADLAVCHLETPLAPPDGPYSSYPLFSVPPQVVPALRHTGYDACTTASNHSIDQGFDGLSRTLRTLDRAGVPHDGTARTAAAQRKPLVLEANGARVAVLSYTYGTNGLPLPEGKPWSVSPIDTERIIREAAAASRAGADVVAVALHFGTEYVTAPDTYQTDVVDQITRSPAIDLVYGHHAHVVQPIDRVHGTWVVYGLGNFIAEQESSRPYTYRGVSVRALFEERRRGRYAVRDVAYLPTMITRFDPTDPRMRVLDVQAALADPATSKALLPELRATLAGVRTSVESLGADVHLLRR